MEETIIYDFSKLLGRIKEKKLTQEELARRIGINERTMSTKLHSKTDFTQGEILKICQELSIDISEAHSYFFVEETQLN